MGNYWLFSERSLDVRNHKKKHILDNLFYNSSITKENNKNAIIENINSIVDALLAKKDITFNKKKFTRYSCNYFINSVFGMSDLISVKKLFAIIIFFVLLFAVITSATSFVDSDDLTNNLTDTVVEDSTINNSTIPNNETINDSSVNLTTIDNIISNQSANYSIPSSNITYFNESQNETIGPSGLNLSIWLNKNVYFVNEKVLISGILKYNNSLINTTVKLSIIGLCHNSSIDINVINGRFNYEFIPIIDCNLIIIAEVTFSNETITEEIGFDVMRRPINNLSRNVTDLAVWDDTDDKLRYVGDKVTFYAKFSRNNISIDYASCLISFNLSGWTEPEPMTFIDGVYVYNRSFDTYGSFEYNVLCSAQGFKDSTMSGECYISQREPVFFEAISGIKVGSPVLWKQSFQAEDNLTVNISKYAYNITVSGVASVNDILIIENSSNKSLNKFNKDKKKSILAKGVNRWLSRVKKNPDNTQYEYNLYKLYSELRSDISHEEVFNETYDDIERYLSGFIFDDFEIQLVISNVSGLIEITYQTESPEIEEEQIGRGIKRITISSDIHYENVLAYTQLQVEASPESVKLFHLINDTRQEVEINKFDLDNNSLIDYIEWIVPSLSNQTYELIIEISKAEHLDENRDFISDIYNEVYKLDNIWSETIPSGHFVRVTFETSLDNSRDITLFPRIINGTPRILIYEVDKDIIIAEFENLTSYEYNKVYLTNLSGIQDTFDLLVLDGDVEIDYIVDPSWQSPSSVYNYCCQNAGQPASNTIDGNTGTYWLTSAWEIHYIEFDMGQTYTVSSVRCYDCLDWDSTNVYVSDDPLSWGAAVASAFNFQSATWVECDVTDKDGRYIRLETTGNEWNSEMYEFEAYVSGITIPEITMNSPINGSGEISPVTLNVTVNNSAGENMGVKFYGDGVLINWTNTTGNQTVTYDWNVGGGIHTWNVSVNTTAGTNDSDVRWFAVDYFNDTFDDTIFTGTTFVSTYNNMTHDGDGNWTVDTPAGVVISKVGTDTSSSGNALTLEFSHTLVSGSNRLVVVYVGIENGDVIDVSGVTYGGQAMVKAVDGLTGTTGYRYLSEIWYILDANLPSDGSNLVSITCSGTLSTLEITGYCAEYTGFNQDIPELIASTNESASADDTIENSISPSADAWVFSAVGCGNAGTGWAHGQGQNEIYDFQDASSRLGIAELRGALGSETSLSSTFSTGANRMTRIAASFIPASSDLDFDGNITSIAITKPVGSFWSNFYAEVNNTVNSTFSIINATTGTVIQSSLVGNGDSISSITDDVIKLYGFFNGSVKLSSWNLSWTTVWSNKNPINSNPNPSNGATGQILNPTLSIKVNDADYANQTVNVTFRTNASGSWADIGSNNSINPTSSGVTLYQNTINMNNYNTKYWWSVNTSDGEGGWDNDTYYFITQSGLPFVTTNTTTGLEETNVTLNGWLQDDGSAITTCGFRFGTSSGIYSENFTKGSYSSNTEFSNNNISLIPGQIYYYQAWASNSNGFANGTEIAFLTKPNVTIPGSFISKANSSSIVYLTWTAGDGANTTYIERNSTAATSWARGEGTIIYNGSGTNYEDTGLTAGTTYYYQAWSYANWTYTPILYHFSDENTSVNITTNNPPTQSGESPTNGSSGITLEPYMYVICSDSDDDLLNATWWSNSSGAWAQFGSNETSFSSGTNISQNNSNFSDYGITYWWSVNVSDGEGDWINETYHFTTGVIGTSVDTISPYNISSSPLALTATGPSDLDNVTLFYRWSKDNTTWGSRSISIFEDFESGSQNSSLWNTYQTPASDARIQWNYGTAHGGSYSCSMDDFDTDTGDAALNVIYTNYDFTGATDINIDFWEREWGDEPEDAPDSWTGWGNYDVVAFTNDGNTWYEIVSEASLNVGAFTNFQYNISADPDFSSPPTSSFAIAFQQYDNYQLINDGRAWDDIYINFTISDEANGTNWIEWSDGSNPDAVYPWGWSFDFPNGTGYYEFYSIGKRSGSPDEVVPGSADAICNYVPPTRPIVITNISSGVEETNTTLRGYLSSDGGVETTCGFRYGVSSGVYSENFSVGVVSNTTEFSNNNGSLTQGQIYFYQAWANNSVGFANGSELTFLTKPEASSGLTAQSNSTSMIYLNWNPGIGSNNTYIERNASGVSVWDRGSGTMIYNGSGTNFEDSGLSEGITYYYQAWSYANWSYHSTTLFQWSDGNASANNITHDRPKIDLVNPSPNGTTGESTLPICQIWANDSDSSTLDVYWFENSTGSYILRNSNISVSANSIFSYTFTEFSNYSATYYWKVAVNDSTYNTTEWFNFSTHLIDTSIDTIVPYIVTYSPYNLTVSGYPNLDKVNLWYQYSIDNISWSGWMQNVTDTLSPWKWSFTFSNGTGYYEFYSLGNKTGSPNETVPGSADAICHFNVSVNNPPIQSNEYPANQSTGIDHTPQLSVTVNDGDLDILNATWWSNSSGSWVQFGSNLSIDTSEGSVNIIQTNSNFSDYGTIYWWSVNLTDEIVWTNETYYFTTALINTSVDTISPYTIENIDPLSLSTTGPSDLDEVILYYRWSDDNVSWGHNGETDYDTPEIDNVASETENAGATSMSWSHTVGSALSNSILIVGVNLEDDDAGDNYFVSSADFNGDALVLAERAAADEGFTAISEIWYLLSPDEGSHTITVNFSVAINNAFGGSVSFSNVSQSVPDDVSNSSDIGTPSGISTSVTSVSPNSLIVAVATDGNSGFTYTYGSEEIEIYNIDGTTHHGVGSYRIPVSAGSFSMYANLSGGTNRMSQTVAAWSPSSTVWGNGSDWALWSNASNPDSGYPWGWNFDFPNSTGYYEFYSIGNKSGSPDEVAPISADAICYLMENLTIEITPSQWNIGTITIGSFVNTTGNYFKLSNNGTVSLIIQIKASNATNITTGAQWNLTSIPGFNNFSLQYNKSADVSWTNVNLTYDTFITNLAISSWQLFDLKLIMATASTNGDPLTLTVTFRSVAS